MVSTGVVILNAGTDFRIDFWSDPRKGKVSTGAFEIWQVDITFRNWLTMFRVLDWHVDIFSQYSGMEYSDCKIALA